VPGFCKSASTADIAAHGHVLTPGRYVGAEEVEDDGVPFEEKMPRLVAELEAQSEALWLRTSDMQAETQAMIEWSHELMAERMELQKQERQELHEALRLHLQRPPGQLEGSPPRLHPGPPGQPVGPPPASQPMPPLATPPPMSRRPSRSSSSSSATATPSAEPMARCSRMAA
jgi:hypothetical protein